MANNFLESTEENADHNQYWYSAKTIEKIVEDLSTRKGSRIAFLSTPSLYFSLPEEDRALCFVFDFDRKWEADRGFVFYDFNQPPEAIPAHLHGTFDAVVIDPPFITRDVWEKYAATANALLKRPPLSEAVVSAGGEAEGCSVLCTTVFENAPLMDELFHAKPQAFMPSIPNLVYQYNLYTNYKSAVFDQRNPEIPE